MWSGGRITTGGVWFGYPPNISHPWKEGNSSSQLPLDLLVSGRVKVEVIFLDPFLGHEVDVDALKRLLFDFIFTWQGVCVCYAASDWKHRREAIKGGEHSFEPADQDDWIEALRMFPCLSGLSELAEWFRTNKYTWNLGLGQDHGVCNKIVDAATVYYKKTRHHEGENVPAADVARG